MLTFTATGQKLRRTDSTVIVAGTRELYQCVFTFDSAWDGYARVAVFHGSGLARTRVLAADACDIPWECITDVGRLRVGVYGINGDTRMPTLWAEEINVRPGSYDATDEPLPPTQSEYEQIINIMQTQATDATRAEAAQAAAEEARDEAAGSASDAAGSATRAAASEGAADTANAAAQESAEAAQGSETAAKTSETNAGQSATDAAAAKTAAEQARDRAETARTGAESARVTATERAAAAALSAVNAANVAAGVQGIVSAAAERARDAGLAADAAAAYAAAAEGSAEDAAAAKAAAIDKAVEADTASRNAIAAEIVAGGHATNAAGSAQAAENSATLARVDYDIDGDRIGFKRGNAEEFEYTPHLTGATGTTAYASAVLGGYTGTEAQFYLDVAKVTPAIDTDTTTTITLADNTEYRRGEVASLSLSVPATLPASYHASLAFTSGTTAPTITDATSAYWSGDGVTWDDTNSVYAFVPVADRRYTVTLTYDGTALYADVHGVIV